MTSRTAGGHAAFYPPAALTHPLRPAEIAEEFAPLPPGEGPELCEGDFFGVQSPVGLDAPAQVGTLPGAEPIAARETPQDANHHLLVTCWFSRPAWRNSR